MKKLSQASSYQLQPENPPRGSVIVSYKCSQADCVHERESRNWWDKLCLPVDLRKNNFNNQAKDSKTKLEFGVQTETLPALYGKGIKGREKNRWIGP